MTDCRPVSIFSLQSARQLSEETETPIDKRRFRANVYVDLASDQGFGENELVGRSLKIGPKAIVRVLERDPRCAIITLDPTVRENTGDAGSASSKAWLAFTVQSLSKACCTKAIQSNCWIRSLLSNPKTAWGQPSPHSRDGAGRPRPALHRPPLCAKDSHDAKMAKLSNRMCLPVRPVAVELVGIGLSMVSLGATWILDGLEVTLAGACGRFKHVPRRSD